VPLAELTAWPLQDARYHEVRICGDREWSREIPDPPRTQSTQSRRHCRHTLLRAANHQPALVWVSIPANLGGPLLDVISHSKAIALALNLLPFAGIASLWFIAVVRNRLAALEDRFFATVFFGEWTPICGNGPRTTRSPLHIGCTCRRICPGLDQCARNPHTDWRLRSRSRPGLSNPGA